MQRQRGVVVLQQDDAPAGHLPGKRVMGVRVERRAGVTGGERYAYQLRNPGNGGVQCGLIQRTTADRFHEPPVAVRVGTGHGEVEAGADRLDPVGDRAPVGHDETLVAPLAAQHLGQQPVVLGGEDPVDAVVRAHDRPRFRPRDNPLERAQVDLAQRALVDVGGDPHPVGLLAVDRVVLQGRTDAAALQAVDPLDREDAGEQRVLGEVLEVAAAERAALEVDAGAEQDLDVHGSGLVTEGFADPAGERRVPGRAERDRRREARRRLAGEQLRGVGQRLAHPVRAVGEHDVGHAGDGGAAPEAAAAGDGCLFPKVHGGVPASRYLVLIKY
ncbi:hypothetical protein GCM10027610_087680 [Dactylosporangium cerinum]